MAGRPVPEIGAPSRGRVPEPHPSPASTLAAEIKRLVVAGERDQARDRFGALVALLQRRALRVAFSYLRDAADADEAVQDAFVKVFLHIEQYRDDLPFDVWFTRILVNASLDRLKARARQQRYVAPAADETDERSVEQVPSTDASTERRLLARERWAQVSKAVAAWSASRDISTISTAVDATWVLVAFRVRCLPFFLVGVRTVTVRVPSHLRASEVTPAGSAKRSRDSGDRSTSS